ncbi:U-box domain containing protein [Nitzschia inconspicua]|uniref:U-box domain containing protein n=1 Tax=Nitzschia inconspicua TaxID=303405 RepID=A0A9K3KYM7_9STRA|nr:U-box domain containing protein [Nitzschia inconspicua]
MASMSTSSVSAPPSHFVCPLSNKLMKHPVMDGAIQLLGASNIVCFERSSILKALKSSPQCPITGRPLSPDNLVINTELQWKIKYWVKKNHRGNFEQANGTIANVTPTTSRPHSQPRRSTTDPSCTRDTTEAPFHFYCPLSQQIMDDPVASKSNPISFERQHILKWLELEPTCPVTGDVMTKSSLVRNTVLSKEIESWRQQQRLQQPSCSGSFMSCSAQRLPVAMLESLPTSIKIPSSPPANRLESLSSLLDQALECSLS